MCTDFSLSYKHNNKNDEHSKVILSVIKMNINMKKRMPNGHRSKLKIEENYIYTRKDTFGHQHTVLSGTGDFSSFFLFFSIF